MRSFIQIHFPWKLYDGTREYGNVLFFGNMFLMEAMISDSKYVVIVLLNLSVSYPLLSYYWYYVLISLPFTTSPFFHSGFLLDNIGIGTRGLVVRKYFWRFNIYYYRMWQYDSVNYHLYKVSSKFFPGVPMLVRIDKFLF